MNIKNAVTLIVLGVVAVMLVVELVPILEAERIAVPASAWENLINITITILPIVAVAGIVYGAVRFMTK